MEWRIYGFMAGVLVFGASFLLGMKLDERVSRAVNGERDSWLSLLYNAGLFVGAFLMFIWPQIS